MIAVGKNNRIIRIGEGHVGGRTRHCGREQRRGPECQSGGSDQQ
jgi:hypothetical protein